jgi:predicted MFS family arabinose efflux permease
MASSHENLAAVGAKPSYAWRDHPWYKWYALGLLFVVGVYNYVDRLSINILQVQIREEFGLSDAELGALTGVAFAIVYTGLSIPIARLADRKSRKLIIVVCLIFWSIMTIGCGFATGFFMLMLMRMGVAIGEAGSTPPSHALVADLFPPNERTIAMGIWSLSVPLGQVAGFGISGWLGAELGWRDTFIVLGALGLVVAPLVLFTLNEPARYSLDNRGDAVPDVPPFLESLRILWSSRALRHIIAGGTCNAFVIFTFVTWNAPFYHRAYGLSLDELGGTLALMVGAGSGLGMIIGGFVAERAGRRDVRWRMRIPVVGALLVVPLMLLQLLLVGSLAMSLCFGFLALLFGNFYYPSMHACKISLAPSNLRALVSAIAIVAVNLVGMGVAPFVVGLISDHLRGAYGLGEESLRYAIASTFIFPIWAAYHFWRASIYLPEELKP